MSMAAASDLAEKEPGYALHELFVAQAEMVENIPVSETKCVKGWTECTKEEMCELIRGEDMAKRERFQKMEMTEIPGVNRTLYESGTDGLLCDVTVYMPENVLDEDPVPGMVYLRGSGFCVFSGKEPVFVADCSKQALKGCVVMNVHYSLAYEKSYPGDVEEAMAAMRWFANKREEFNLVRNSGFAIWGDSAGGGIAMCAALTLKEKGELDLITCMHLSRAAFFPYAAKPEDIDGGIPEEIAECHKKYWAKFLSTYPLYSAYNYQYTIYLRSNGTKDMQNPLCWPWFASDEQLKGLPPISMEINECDVMRASKVAMARRLDKAGVKVKANLHIGTLHGGDNKLIAFPNHHTYRYELALRYCVSPKNEEEN